MTPPIALQLYTVRALLEDNFSDNNFFDVMRQVADMGYIGVETAFFPETISLTQAADVFKALDLTVPSVHCEIPLGDQQQGVLALAEAFDCQRLVWHGWPQHEDYSTLDGIKRLAERYNQANTIARANGLSFGLHNHWWEFEPVASAPGQYPYQILCNLMEPDIFFEIDTYWVKTAGLDPVSVVAELGPRAPLLHIKDGPAAKGEPMVAAGQGVMDFPAISRAANKNAEWLIVEMDECATDMLAAVAQSYRYLTENDLAQGKI